MTTLRCLLPLVFFAIAIGQAQDSPVVKHFPGRKDLGVVIWSLPPNPQENISQIVVFRVDKVGNAHALWQSELEPTYAPQIEFTPEIASEGLPVALVRSQFGLAAGELELVGQSAGRFVRLQRITGSFFETKSIDESSRSFIIAHEKPNILDIPSIYRWNGKRLVDVSAAHPTYYRELLHEHATEPYQTWGGLALLDLSRIASLAGDRAKEQELLKLAFQKESARGAAADKPLLQQIAQRLRAIPVGAEN
ncbi:MAG TPA: hypothetical protein VN776_10465 [Terracidiphilus sp.]|nr:hypothetical protein [Terracidiphilus sp.]